MLALARLGNFCRHSLLSPRRFGLRGGAGGPSERVAVGNAGIETGRKAHPAGKRLGMLCLAGALGALDAATVSAQANPRSREYVEGMVRSLMESEMPSGELQNLESRRSTNASAQLRELRANLTGFAQEISQLVTVLHQDVNRTSGLRSLMGEALQVNAQATLLSRQSGSQDDIGWIANEFSTLDQDWRLLVFRLEKLQNLSPQATQFIRRANEFHTRLGQLLQVTPQLDESEVMQQAANIQSDLARLMDEVDTEVDDAAARYNLLMEGRRVYEQSRRFAQLAGQQPSAEQLRAEYKRFRALWTPFAGKLRPLQLRFVDRQLQYIQASDRQLQELLLLPSEVDRSELVYLTELLQRDLDQLMDGVTLRSLTKLTKGRDKIVAASSDFYSACADFGDCVKNGENNETMAELYYYLENSWLQVADVLRNAQSNEARQVYRQLDRSITEIRDILAVHPALDRQRALQLAADLTNQASYYEQDVRSLLAARPANYPAAFRSQCLRAVQDFRAATNKLQQDLEANESMKLLQEQSARVGQAWTALLQTSERFPAAERNQLNETRKQLTPTLVALQAMLSL